MLTGIILRSHMHACMQSTVKISFPISQPCTWAQPRRVCFAPQILSRGAQQLASPTPLVHAPRRVQAHCTPFASYRHASTACALRACIRMHTLSLLSVALAATSRLALQPTAAALRPMIYGEGSASGLACSHSQVHAPQHMAVGMSAASTRTRLRRRPRPRPRRRRVSASRRSCASSRLRLWTQACWTRSFATSEAHGSKMEHLLRRALALADPRVQFRE